MSEPFTSQQEDAIRAIVAQMIGRALVGANTRLAASAAAVDAPSILQTTTVGLERPA